MIRAVLLTLVFITGLLASCVEKGPEPLSREKMKEIMTDIHLAEVYTSVISDSSGLSGNKNKDTLAVYYKSILDHHGISVDEFSSSLRWYSSEPHELDSVYINVLNELSTLEGLINAGAGE